jgi:hypothetical protein
MKLRTFGAGIAMSASLTGAALALPASAYASTSCYTGCHTSTPTHGGGTPTVNKDGGSDGTTQAHALAFTGANVILPTSIGAGAIVIGGTLFFAGRRRRVHTVS